jgi:hypothetical protein
MESAMTQESAMHAVASPKVRDLVRSFKQRGGFPAPYSTVQEELRDLSEEQKRALHSFREAVTTYAAIAEEGWPDPGTPWWEAVVKMRRQLHEALEAGLIRVPIIRNAVVAFGAVPDPASNWSFYRLPDGSYACWECGGAIHTKQVSLPEASLELADQCAGFSAAGVWYVPYCPYCEAEPSGDRTLTSLDEALAHKIAVHLYG